MSALPATTIAVVTRDRADRLASCLAALAAQGAAEILVVDDGSRERAAVAAVAHARGARIVHQDASGVATARNTAAKHAHGEFVVFTDDDCVPADGWAAALSARLCEGSDVVAGPTVAARPERALDDAWHLIADTLTTGSRCYEALRFAPGSNFGARADVLARVRFDPRFDGVGAEDRDWWARLHGQGLRTTYAAEAIVLHAPDLTVLGFMRKQGRYGRGAYRFRAAHHEGRVEATKFYARLVRDGIRRRPAVGALVALAQAAAATGYAAERLSTAFGAGEPKNVQHPLTLAEAVEVGGYGGRGPS